MLSRFFIGNVSHDEVSQAVNGNLGAGAPAYIVSRRFEIRLFVELMQIAAKRWSRRSECGNRAYRR
jgi:hypothetical protein